MKHTTVPTLTFLRLELAHLAAIKARVCRVAKISRLEYQIDWVDRRDWMIGN